jgi:predicted PurR-regulated permease PerM
MILLILVAAGFSLGALLGTSLNRFLTALPSYQERLTVHLEDLVTRMKELGLQLPEGKLQNTIDPAIAMRLAGNLVTALSNVMANMFFILLTVVFILLEAADFPKKLNAVLKKPESSLSAIEKFSRSANRYVMIKTLISLMTGLTFFLWLLFLGVDYPVLWGILAFLLNYVPNIGSIIAAVPAVLLALIQLGVNTAILTAAGFLAISNLLGNLVEPKLMGKGLGLSPLVVFVSLVFWGYVLGPMGMILSVPLTSLVKIAMESNEETRRFARMLGSFVEA